MRKERSERRDETRRESATVKCVDTKSSVHQILTCSTCPWNRLHHARLRNHQHLTCCTGANCADARNRVCYSRERRICSNVTNTLRRCQKANGSTRDYIISTAGSWNHLEKKQRIISTISNNKHQWFLFMKSTPPEYTFLFKDFLGFITQEDFSL